MVLKSYFDGGNQADSREYDVLSLAVISAPEDVWTPFERDWKEMLTRHHAPPLHTTDAVARVKEFSGWSKKKVDSLLRDAARICERHFIKINSEYLPGQFGIYGYVISVVLKDFVEFAKGNPDTVVDANEGCFRQAIGDLLLWSKDKAFCEHVQCFFDQGEPFYGYLVNLMHSKQAKADAFLLNKIVVRSELDSRVSPALQMADLFAWCESHRNEPWNPDWKKRVMRLPYQKEWRDKTNLHYVNEAHQTAWNTWKIPKRAATK